MVIHGAPKPRGLPVPFLSLPLPPKRPFFFLLDRGRRLVFCFYRFSSGSLLGTWQHFNPKGLPLPHLTYVGHTILTGATSSDRLAAEAVRLSGLPDDTPIDLYEQVS